MRKKFQYLAIAVDGGTLYVQSCHNQDGDLLFNSIKEGDRLITSSESLIQSKIRTVKTKSGLGRQKI